MRNKLVINGLIICSAIVIGGALTVGPWRVFMVQRAQESARVQQMHLAESNTIRLQQAQDRADTSIGHEEASRKAGFLGPGEVSENSGKS